MLAQWLGRRKAGAGSATGAKRLAQEGEKGELSWDRGENSGAVWKNKRLFSFTAVDGGGYPQSVVKMS